MPCQCVQCQERRTKQSHRKPCNPKPFSNKGSGFCVVCGETVYKGGKKEGETVSRGWWHSECLHDYSIQYDANYARKYVFERDKGICATCGNSNSIWELDHIIPLIDGGGFGLDNMQTLCIGCHKKKTSMEATDRAAKRRGQLLINLEEATEK